MTDEEKVPWLALQAAGAIIEFRDTGSQTWITPSQRASFSRGKPWKFSGSPQQYRVAKPPVQMYRSRKP